MACLQGELKNFSQGSKEQTNKHEFQLWKIKDEAPRKTQAKGFKKV